MNMKHNAEHGCCHGFLLWWNYGDGKPRHWSEEFGPLPKICDNPGEKES